MGSLWSRQDQARTILASFLDSEATVAMTLQAIAPLVQGGHGLPCSSYDFDLTHAPTCHFSARRAIYSALGS
jgi:hypothetical protein